MTAILGAMSLTTLQVVADEDHAETELRAQVREQVEDLRLNRHVEGADRLVGDQHLRLGGQCPGDADPLALPAGEVGGIPVDGAGREPHLVEELLHAPGDPVAGHQAVHQQHLSES